MNNFRSPKAFTIMEILIVVIIVGIIAAFAIPNYGTSVAQSHLQDAIMQLSAIRTANQVYRAKTGSYWPTVAGAKLVGEINSSLSLNIIENGMTYTCNTTTAGTTFTCTATTTPPGDNSFTTTVTEAALSSTNPQCTTGKCP